MKAKKASFTALLIIFLMIAGAYADIAPFPGGGGRGNPRPLTTQVLIVAALACGVIVLAVIAIISWLVIRRMRKKKAAEKPVDGAPQEQPKAG